MVSIFETLVIILRPLEVTGGRVARALSNSCFQTPSRPIGLTSKALFTAKGLDQIEPEFWKRYRVFQRDCPQSQTPA